MRTLILALTLAATATAQFQDVRFAVDTPADLVPGEAIFVSGNVDALGAGDVTRSIKLVDHGKQWRAVIRLPAGIEYTYRFLARSIEGPDWGDSENARPVGQSTEASTAAAQDQRARRITYRGPLKRPKLAWRSKGDAEFSEMRMKRSAGGRQRGEATWRANRVGTPGQEIEFYITDSRGKERLPAEGSFVSALDTCWLQDDELFGYEPAHSVAPARRDYRQQAIPTIQSSVLGEQRGYRVFLPRGYDEHSERRYPVLYANDGWLWLDDGPNSMDLDGKRIAELVRRGRISEFILVGISHADRSDPKRFFENRIRDYIPPRDFATTPWGVSAGAADRYARFVVEELKPAIDAKYRTLTGRESTWIMGFSCGGVAAVYLGWTERDTFGRIAAFAGALQIPQFMEWLEEQPRIPTRVYLDSGTKQDYLLEALTLYDELAGHDDGWIIEGDLRLRVGFGQSHTTKEASTRLTDALEFLAPANDPALVVNPTPASGRKKR